MKVYSVEQKQFGGTLQVIALVSDQWKGQSVEG